MSVTRLSKNLPRELHTLEDENNPRSSKINIIWPSTVLDQVYDQESPSKKNLRDIIEDLKQEIITGGKGNIVFPVTSVNGMTEDVNITKQSVGLGRVDNTRDIDKPLSIPQRDAIMEILLHYDFNIDLSDLHDHIMDTSNPHMVTLSQINENGEVEDFVKRLISDHNLSTKNTVHMDIRRSLSSLWNIVDSINGTIEDRIKITLDTLNEHFSDKNAHINLFNKKEDNKNKVESFTDIYNYNHTQYPSTRAVGEYVTGRLCEFDKTITHVENWIDDIKVIDSRNKLPTPSKLYDRKVYFIRYGERSFSEIAVCRYDSTNDTYAWDISSLNLYSQFDNRYLIDSPNGLSINISSITDMIFNQDGSLDTTLVESLKKYYTKDEIDKKHFVDEITIIPGKDNGTIAYYINGDISTLSDDIRISGLKRLGYLEYVTEDEIKDESIHSRHILSQAVSRRHIQLGSVDAPRINCRPGFIIGNLDNENNYGQELSIQQLKSEIKQEVIEEFIEMTSEEVRYNWIDSQV